MSASSHDAARLLHEGPFSQRPSPGCTHARLSMARHDGRLVVQEEMACAGQCARCAGRVNLNASIVTKRHGPWLQTHACTVLLRSSRRSRRIQCYTKSTAAGREHGTRPGVGRATSPRPGRRREGPAPPPAWARARTRAPHGAPARRDRDRRRRLGRVPPPLTAARTGAGSADHEMQLQMIDGIADWDTAYSAYSACE